MRSIIFFLLLLLSLVSFSQDTVNYYYWVRENSRLKTVINGQWYKKEKIFFYNPPHYNQNKGKEKPKYFKIKYDGKTMYRYDRDFHAFTTTHRILPFFSKSFTLKSEHLFFTWNSSYFNKDTINLNNNYPNDIFRMSTIREFMDSIYYNFDSYFDYSYFLEQSKLINKYNENKEAEEPLFSVLIEEGKPIPKKIEEEFFSNKREHWVVQRAGVRFYLYNIKKKNLGKYLEMIMSFEEIPYEDTCNYKTRKPNQPKQDIFTLKAPENLTEAFEILNNTLSDEDIDRLKTLPQDSMTSDKLFADYKGDFANAWGLFKKKNTKLKKLFKKHKVNDSKQIYRYILILYNIDLKHNPMYVKTSTDDKQVKWVSSYYALVDADTIKGVYIPKNIEDCFLTLNRILDMETIETIKSLPHRDSTNHLHFSLGMYLRNNWGLWGGSRLSHYFETRGVQHPDSMSGLIIEYYYDWLNNRNEDWMEFDKNIKR